MHTLGDSCIRKLKRSLQLGSISHLVSSHIKGFRKSEFGVVSHKLLDDQNDSYLWRKFIVFGSRFERPLNAQELANDDFALSWI